MGQRPVLTGPQSLTHQEMVAVIGDAIGRPLRYRETPPSARLPSEAFVDAFRASGS